MSDLELFDSKGRCRVGDLSPAEIDGLSDDKLAQLSKVRDAAAEADTGEAELAAANAELSAAIKEQSDAQRLVVQKRDFMDEWRAQRG